MKSLSRESANKVRVLVANSNRTQSQLLLAALRRQPRLEVSICRSETSDCLARIEGRSTDVILLGDGLQETLSYSLETVRAIRLNFPAVAIVLLLNSYDRNVVVGSLRAGARGLFCQASQPFKALCKCIQAVHDGQVWMNGEQMEYVIEELVQTARGNVVELKRNPLLTPREKQVVTLVAEGLCNREAAKQLNVTENTVKKSLLRIFDKLGVSNRVELVLYALSQSDPAVEGDTEPADAKRISHDTKSKPAPDLETSFAMSSRAS